MWAIENVLEPCMLLFISNICLKYAPKWMVSSSIFQKFSGEGLTEPPPPVFSRASPSVRASPSILRRFAPSNRASPSILGRFAPSIRASPSTFGWKLGLAPPKINSWIRHCTLMLLISPLLHWCYSSVPGCLDAIFRLPAKLMLILIFLLHWCYFSVPCCIDALHRFPVAIMLLLSSLLHWCYFTVSCCIYSTYQFHSALMLHNFS